MVDEMIRVVVDFGNDFGVDISVGWFDLFDFFFC